MAVMNKFLLYDSPKALHWRIIKAVPLSTHRYLHVGLTQYLAVLVGAILDASVRVV